jgi:Predicted hydrolases of the HAD superfamily
MTLYVSDLDGTLLDNEGQLPNEAAEIINGLMDKGLQFTYATARSFSSAGKITSALKLKLPVITYSGVVVGDGVTMRYEMPPKAELANLFQALEREKIAPLVYAVIGGKERCSWIRGLETHGIQNYVRSRDGNERMRPVESFAALFEGEIFYFSHIGTKEQMQRAKELFAAAPVLNAHIQQDTYFPEDFWMEAFSAGANKACAVQMLKKQLGADKLVCFGDNLNDIPMFKVADECYAVENACEEVKKRATAVISSNEEYGVAKWLHERAKKDS